MSQAETKKQSGRNWAHIIRDIVETIAFALVLVLVFREFAFGGYVIPTGSMAPTLYGAHRTQICPDCGSEYAYGIHQQDLPSGGVQLLLPKRVVCPNCRWLEHPPPLYQGGRVVFDGGDRIMVVKVGYELAEWFPKLAGYLAPKRWDVVVFKSPAEPEINVIKRLVGLPGEKIEIIDGDIYANDKIQRKSAGAQQALWFTVYDADYLPNRQQAAKPAWRDVDGPGPSLWDTSGRVMTFAGRDKPGESATIEFVGTVVDYYAYADLDRQQFGRSIVSDLRLSMLLVPGAGTTAGGSIQLRLSKGNDLLVAEIDLTGRVRLLKGTRQPPGQGQMELLSQQSLAPITKPTVVSFANVDHRLSVSLNGREILSSTDDQYPAV